MLITGIIVMTDNARRSGNMIKETIASSHTVVVEVIKSPPVVTQTGRVISFEWKRLVWDDIAASASLPYVESLSFIYPFTSVQKAWMVNFDANDLAAGDIITNNPLMFQTISIKGVKNTQFSEGEFKLTEGRHITDEDNGKNVALISNNFAELLGVGIGDTLFFPFGALQQEEHKLPGEHERIMSGEYEIVGLVDFIPEVVIMYVPYWILPPEEMSEDNPEYWLYWGIGLSEVKFILKSPETAADFIEQAMPYLEGLNYDLQANDYEYKREIYPVEMMINLNFTLYIACIVAGTLLTSVIIMKAAFSRGKDIAVMRFLACKRIYIFFVFFMEKFIVMLAGILAGLAAGVLLEDLYKNINSVYDIPRLGIGLNVIFSVSMIALVCSSLATVIFISAAKKKPMEAITHE
jgi:putative ABC transport system permease protein